MTIHCVFAEPDDVTGAAARTVCGICLAPHYRQAQPDGVPRGFIVTVLVASTFRIVLRQLLLLGESMLSPARQKTSSDHFLSLKNA